MTRALLATLTAALVLPATAHADLRAYGPDRKLAPGARPAGGARTLELVAPRDGFASGQISVRGGGGTVAWTPGSSPELPRRTTLALVARTQVAGRQTPDPLPPLAGPVAAPAVVYVRVSTHGLAAGTYRGRLGIGAESIPVSLTVARWSLPPRHAGFRTLFQLQPQSYFSAVGGMPSLAAARATNTALFRLLADYRIAPGDWGYGTPAPGKGYVDGPSWQSQRATRMREQSALGFNTLRVPLSNQRHVGPLLGRVSPREPETWSPWLALVRPFWLTNGLAGRAVAYTWDEPGPGQYALLAQQGRSLAAGFPEAKLLATMTPAPGNHALRDGGPDDVDVWAVLSRRFYGSFNRPRASYALVDALRRRTDKEVWSVTYRGVAGSPGYSATEPLTNVRLFFAWNALERTRGTLYAQGMVTYHGRDPWQALPGHGESVLIYPGRPEPVSSLRLEAIRDGIQDANVLAAYSARFGRPALVRLLARNGLFRARGGRLLLGCTRGCDLRTGTKFSWPVWQRDERRASAGLERARRAALAAVSR
jgi:hypothetical protein